MAVSAINQVPSPNATFPLPVTSQPWGLALLWGQLTWFHCQPSPAAALPAAHPSSLLPVSPRLLSTSICSQFSQPKLDPQALESCRSLSSGLSCRADGAAVGAVGCAVPQLQLGAPALLALEGG